MDQFELAQFLREMPNDEPDAEARAIFGAHCVEPTSPDAVAEFQALGLPIDGTCTLLRL